MSNSSTSRFNPVLLATVGVLVVAAVAIGIMVIGAPDDEEASTESGSSKSGAKSPRLVGSSLAGGGSQNSKKSDGVRDGSRPDQNAKSPYPSGSREQLFLQTSIDAREELKLLRDKYATPFDDPEERRAFGVRLAQITDPQERQRVLQERTEEMRQARAKADSTKTQEDRDREKELIALMQVQNLWRMADFVAKNRDLQTEVDRFQDELADWVQSSETSDAETFHNTFNSLRHNLNELRKRNAQAGAAHPQATPANLPSRRPERNQD